MKRIDLTGQRFGRLVAIREDGKTKDGRTIWMCRCDCGDSAAVSVSDLRSGHTKSCGCWKLESATKHGQYQTRLYSIWETMKQRCSNPNRHNYVKYGGRGIAVCREWAENFQSFYDWAMVNGYRDDLQIDRVDNDGDYEPGNCRWVPYFKNIMNRSNTVRIAYQGKNLTIQEWTEITGLPKTTIRERYRTGKPPEEILKTK